MKQIVMEVHKFNGKSMTTIGIDITPLDELLTPEELFMMEFKLNEIGKLRFHISMNEIHDEVK